MTSPDISSPFRQEVTTALAQARSHLDLTCFDMATLRYVVHNLTFRSKINRDLRNNEEFNAILDNVWRVKNGRVGVESLPESYNVDLKRLHPEDLDQLLGLFATALLVTNRDLSVFTHALKTKTW